ncbi:hypothetical protein [Aeromonas taiwanensis]|uniref:hypothetical protein n=1 Tax=Aeromonas taiwanensis TaxID=633417 RepID=UPI003F74828B
MATYTEKVEYDWSSPAQLNDWTVVASGGTGTATIVNGKLVLATSRASTNGINIISKAGGFNAVEVEFKMTNAASPSTMKYFDISIGSGAVADDTGKVPGTDVWHQGLASSRVAILQDNTPTGYFMREFSGGGMTAKSSGGFYGSPDFSQPHKLLVIAAGAVTQVNFDGETLQAGNGFTVSETGQVMIHQGYHAPTGWGADAVISKITLYKNYDHYGDLGFKPVALSPIPANQESRAQFQPQDVVWRGSPGAVYAGPMIAPKTVPDVFCKGLDQAWIRDGVQNVLQGYIESTVTINGEGVRRRVLCFDQAGNLVGETMSRASDGKYRFDLLWLNRRYMLVAQDDPAFGPADYNAVAADFQLPTPYAPGEGVGLA